MEHSCLWHYFLFPFCKDSVSSFVRVFLLVFNWDACPQNNLFLFWDGSSLCSPGWPDIPQCSQGINYSQKSTCCFKSQIPFVEGLWTGLSLVLVFSVLLRKFSISLAVESPPWEEWRWLIIPRSLHMHTEMIPPFLVPNFGSFFHYFLD